jgi:arginine utilization regulatory protein
LGQNVEGCGNLTKGFDMSKEVLEAILSGIDEAIHVVDTDGKTIFYNEVAARNDGLTIEEVVGKPLLKVFPSLNKGTSTLLKVMETKKPIFNQAQIYTNVYGKKIETMNTTLPIFVDNVLVGAMEIGKDYSRMKKLSEQLVDLQRKVLPVKNIPRKNNSVSYTLNDFITKDIQLLNLKREAYKLAKSHSPMLVFGESGTGKEVFIQGVHSASNRASAPFIAQNCAAIPETLLESILFGTAKGSYTGAVDRPGLFELANGGTLFLDELHGMPIDLQAKLLRVLEDRIVRRVGGQNSFYVDVRVIAAMNIHPKKALEMKMLRPDLFYRLNVLMFELTPLRNRKEDILLLSDVFVENFNRSLHKQVKSTADEVKALFLHYPWPGNVRELKHSIEYMMNVCEDDYLQITDLPIMLKEYAKNQTMNGKRSDTSNTSLKIKVECYEKDLIHEALLLSEGSIKKAAEALRIPRQTLQYKLHKYQLHDAE